MLKKQNKTCFVNYYLCSWGHLTSLDSCAQRITNPQRRLRRGGGNNQLVYLSQNEYYLQKKGLEVRDDLQIIKAIFYCKTFLKKISVTHPQMS